MSDDKKKDSEEYIQFEAAMRSILRVRKEDIAQRFPEMFRKKAGVAKK